MLNVEIDSLTTYMGKLWPGWKPTEVELAAWGRLLGRLPNEQAARKALDCLWESSRFARPSPRDFRVQINLVSQAQANQTEEENEKDGMTGAWIQCFEAPERFPSRLGWAVPICYRRADKIPPPHIIMQVAEKKAAEHSHTYGGNWRIITEATRDDMKLAKSELQAAACQAAKEKNEQKTNSKAD